MTAYWSEAERAALASYDDAPLDASRPCAWCDDEAQPGEIQLSRSKFLPLCAGCERDLMTAFTPSETTP